MSRPSAALAAAALVLAFIRAMRTAPNAGPEWAELEQEFIRRASPCAEASIPQPPQPPQPLPHRHVHF